MKPSELFLDLLIILGIIFTVIAAAVATGNSSSYAPSMNAWFATLIIPVILALMATAYYNEKVPYEKTGEESSAKTDEGNS